MADASKTVSITEARKRIFEIADDLQMPGVHYTLTERGRPRVVLVCPEEYEGWMETLDIMAEDPGALKAVQRGRANFKKGNFIRWDDIKQKYGVQSASRSKRRKRAQ